ncbi:hypothetical protein RN001_015492 [Aquatica leii]|uniref:Pacifastin domain-containing protein n=1 Tax=Aquatica leii TaxID=1421715 RepID=A0AAN7SL86_9COLE|nr:hypothetical protein RN001_015492 [Aquatica leii]
MTIRNSKKSTYKEMESFLCNSDSDDKRDEYFPVDDSSSDDSSERDEGGGEQPFFDIMKLIFLLIPLIHLTKSHEVVWNTKENFICRPGKIYMVDCNSCVCNDYKRLSCTDMPCIVNQKLCEPNTIWKDRCNKCWCTSNGKTICESSYCGYVSRR